MTDIVDDANTATEYISQWRKKWAIGIILVVSTVLGLVVQTYARVESGMFTALLRLADDASTPKKKGEYLRRFLQKCDDADLPEHGAWIIRTEQTQIAEQKEVLKSLMERCDETAKLDRKSFGYAKGMEQITGQEFEHAIDEIQSTFKKARLISWGWLAVWGWSVPLVLLIIFGAKIGWQLRPKRRHW